MIALKTYTDKMWVVYGKRGAPFLWSLAYSRKDAIRLFLDGSQSKWSERNKYGWKASRVKITVEPILKTKN